MCPPKVIGVVRSNLEKLLFLNRIWLLFLKIGIGILLK